MSKVLLGVQKPKKKKRKKKKEIEDTFELIDVPWSEESVVDAIRKSVFLFVPTRVKKRITSAIDTDSKLPDTLNPEEKSVSLSPRHSMIMTLPLPIPREIARQITQFLRIPRSTKQVRVGKELWMKENDLHFARLVQMLKIKYPWIRNNRCDEENDTYLEAIEIFRRERAKEDFLTVPMRLSDALRPLKQIHRGLPTLAKKLRPADVIGNYGMYHLTNTWTVRLEDIYAARIRERDFDEYFTVYGADLDELSGDLTDEQMWIWRQHTPQIELQKNKILPALKSYLYREPNAIVSHLEITTQSFRHDTSFVYDLYIGTEYVVYVRARR